MVCVMLSVAFFTLLEQNFLGVGQSRKGPNKMGLTGVIQSLVDVVKLFSKVWTQPFSVYTSIFILFPVLNLLLFLLFWGGFPKTVLVAVSLYFFLVYLCLSVLLSFGLLISGWSSSSFYAALGGYRSFIQFLSYDVTLSFIATLLFEVSLWFFDVFNNVVLSLLIGACFFAFFVCLLGESHRAPFDFSEGESELVSGFNTDYSSVYFSIIFLSEYGLLMLTVYLFSWVFFLPLVGVSVLVTVCAIVVLVRCVSPRLRIDFFISFFWLFVLPLSVTLLLLGGFWL